MGGVLADPRLLLGLVLVVGAGIGVTAWSGLRGRRALHFACLGVVVPTFVFTIFVAETVGRAYTFEPLAFRVHMGFAWAATLALLATAATGVQRIVLPRVRRPHRVCVVGFLGLLVGAVGTGLWMMSTGTPLAALS